ncbi:hypothetical protein GCM10011501_13970 [Thalassotalea profundi]|uniref:DUF2550 family protein n=1 Tax=Thalassotalea profundi TaxID=2036687 RepID=A0ABQ3IMZ6_9GAMM|nr:hypothetical protein GCM10011501_13970 [Thalassotalea profundi]
MLNALLVLLLWSTFYPLNNITLLLALSVILYICWRVFVLKKQSQCQLFYQLDAKGNWQEVYNDRQIAHWQISDKSRVALYGCYLVLIPIAEPNTNTMLSNKIINDGTLTKQQFIFKDSLSIEDYARLCRVIRRINVEGEQTVLK